MEYYSQIISTLFFTLHLHYIGELPPDFKSWINIQKFDVSSNQIGGVVTNNFDFLAGVRYLSFFSLSMVFVSYYYRYLSRLNEYDIPSITRYFEEFFHRESSTYSVAFFDCDF